jgi:hypothetical protein
MSFDRTSFVLLSFQGAVLDAMVKRRTRRFEGSKVEGGQCRWRRCSEDFEFAELKRWRSEILWLKYSDVRPNEIDIPQAEIDVPPAEFHRHVPPAEFHVPPAEIQVSPAEIQASPAEIRPLVNENFIAYAGAQYENCKHEILNFHSWFLLLYEL